MSIILSIRINHSFGNEIHIVRLYICRQLITQDPMHLVQLPRPMEITISTILREYLQSKQKGTSETPKVPPLGYQRCDYIFNNRY